MPPLMLMMRPQPAVFINGMIAREQRSAPTYLTLKSSIRSSSTPVSIGPVAVGEPLLRLFGAQFANGYHLMFILAAGLLAHAAIGPIERLLNLLGEQRVCAMVYAAAFATNLIACVLLIPKLGAAGAAMGTTAALIVESTLLFMAAKYRLGFHTFVWGGTES